MTLKELIEKQKRERAAKAAERKTHTDTISEVRTTCDNEKREPSEAEGLRVEAARSAITTIDADLTKRGEKIAELETELAADEAADALTRQTSSTGTRGPAYDEVARVGREERTYTAEKSARGEASFFVDAYGAQRGNRGAWERLERNVAEARAEGELSERATTTASFSSLVVPQYLVDLAAPVARAGRPIANSVNHQQLPSQGMSLTIPRGTAGASAASQATQNTAVSETDEAFTDLVVPVVTIAGQQKTSRQSLERGTPGLDEMIYMDIAGAHGSEVDRQVVNGSGASGQMLGILQTAGITQMSAFTAAATAATFYKKVGGAVNAVQTTRFLAPTVIYGAPRRWNWLITEFDSSGRPLVVPSANGPMNALGVWDNPKDTPSPEPNGSLQGLPFVTDANIPLSVGTGPEDQTIVARREDLLLWEEGNGAPKMLRFDEPLGNQLEVILVGYSYAAFTAGRYPTSVAVIGGNAGTAGFGLVAPTF